MLVNSKWLIITINVIGLLRIKSSKEKRNVFEHSEIKRIFLQKYLADTLKYEQLLDVFVSKCSLMMSDRQLVLVTV